MSNIFDQLKEPFPKDDIHWRAQSITKDGDKAIALAYIDSRNVQERLDAVVGPGNWQDRYEFSGPRTICYLSLRIGDEWITKADGAGDTDVEAEKGAISDAFKRAAVKWGIGRYLYDLDAPWVPCECTEWQGKKRWKRWTANPWSFVKGAPKASAAEMKRGLEAIEQDLLDCPTINEWKKCGQIWASIMDRDGWTPAYRDMAREKFTARKEAIQNEEQKEAA